MVEILGGYCGELTLQSAIKCNADIALIPEAQMPLAVLAELDYPEAEYAE